MGFLDLENFAVWGLARSGVAAANLLARRGKRVVVSDIASADALDEAIGRLHPDVEVVTGRNTWDGADAVVASPGLRPGLPVFQQLPRGLPVVSEVEIAREASNHRWLTITGTDGKTTTTEITTHLLNEFGIEAVAAGNIGTPLSDVVDELSADAVVVAEISAFQLWSTHDFWSTAGAITNIADDHLDYFDKDFEAYAAAKLKLLSNNRDSTTAVLNRDDPRLATFAAGYPGPVVTFGTAVDGGASGLTFDGVHITEGGGKLMQWSKSPLVGRHNALNVMAAAALARSVGADLDHLEAAMCSFEPLPHRIELVRTVDDVKWVNDSKATNAHAAMAGLEALDNPLVVIAGGVDKKLDLAPFAAYLASREAHVVLIGDITQRLARALSESGCDTVERANSLADAVGMAKKAATPGGTVVLSPACSSFDMFSSYVDRGDQFKNLVDALESA